MEPTSSIESKFFFKPNPDFIINGKLKNVIRDTKGNKPASIPNIIAVYATRGNIQKSFVAFCFPTVMTRVFLPLDLSAS